MEQALHINPGVAHKPSLRVSREHLIAWTFNSLVFLAGVITLYGFLMHIPRLYDWDMRGLVMHFKVALTLIVISIGYMFHLASVPLRKPALKFIAMFCYAGGLIFGISRIVMFVTSDSVTTMQMFLQPTSPASGNLSFQTALGISIASAAALVLSLANQKRPWAPWITQILIVSLISLAAFALAENMGPLIYLRHLISIPASVGWLFFAVALLFYPYENLHFRAPFFASGLIRLYTILFCVFWLFIVAWQAIWANEHLGVTNFSAYHLHITAVVDELLEAGLSALILGLGLHILSRMLFLKEARDTLQEANNKLEKALEGISLLSSTLSHDLKTPIKIQMDSVEMLKSGKYGSRISDPTVQEILSAIIDSKQFEHELVLNLVDLMRYQMKEERFSPKPFEVQKLLGDIERDLAPVAERKDQTLVIRDNPDIGSVTADYFGMKRVFHNLVNNAIQHIGPGCRIEVGVEKQGETVLFQVKDNGPGIPPEIQGNLFNRFNRVSSSGLGLYITRQIVTRHGGEIRVESSPGEGTAFYITLPAA